MGESGVCFSNRSRSERPSSVRASALPTPLFYGIAATGSYYFRFNSLRDAPPEGEALNPPPGKVDRRSGGIGASIGPCGGILRWKEFPYSLIPPRFVR